MPRKYSIFAIVTLVVVALDQLSKAWVRGNIEMWRGSISVIDGFFELVYFVNTGAAFGVMQDDPNAMVKFAVFTVVALSIMVLMVWRLPPEEGFAAAMMGAIMGGALGNGVDRLLFRGVTDFLRFYVETGSLADWLRTNVQMTEWPSFNVADSAIVVGVIAFLVQQLFFVDRGATEADLDDEELPDLEEALE